MRLSIHAFVFASLFLALPATGFAEIWTVAADGSGQFTQIQAAVNASQDGDVIHVMPGSYAPFTLSKSVMIVGEGTQLSSIGGSENVSILNVGAGKAGLSHLSLTSSLKIAANTAQILIEDVKGASLSITDSSAALLEKWSGAQASCKNVASLWLVDCSFQGVAGLPAIPGQHGAWKQLPTQGGDAFLATGSTLFVSKSQFTGGQGGAGICGAGPMLINGKLGGSGLNLSSDSTAWIAEGSFQGGAGGSGQTAASSCKSAESGTGLKAGALTKLHWDQKGDALFPLSILDTSNGYVSMEFSGYPDDQILFILSIKAQTPGVDLSPEVGGFPLGVDLGSGQVNYWFLDRTILGDGKLLWKHKLPVDPSMIGGPVFVQAFLYAPPEKTPHVPVLSAPTYWVIDGN